ncbi:MAG TPA: ribosome biogenesis factor YjgA [Burkholderiaceae bacterium]|jgi:ribosome-associated protein|nr:ribosome biogenesis factor YjgA [Burkholderiaceae bacterium]
MRPPTHDDPSDQAASADPGERPSKTRLKQQMHELQRLGEQLAALPPAQLARIELPEKLREQIELARRITAREGLRRQLQYVGRLMRTVDADAIRAALAAVDHKRGPPEAAP